MYLGKLSWICLVLACSILLGWAALVAHDWGDDLRQRSEAVAQDISDVEQRLDGLVPLRVANVMGRFGYRTQLFADAVPDEPPLVTVDLKRSYPIDQIFLLPVAKREEADGRDASFMFPRCFRVSVSETKRFASPVVVFDHTTSDFEDNRPYPVRIEFPPVTARYVRVEFVKLNDSPAMESYYESALSEIFVFSDGVNVALGQQVDADDERSVDGVYDAQYLVDGQTWLGLPGRQIESVEQIGWHSRVFERELRETFVELQFADPVTVDTVILYPAQARQMVQLATYGFPERFEILGQVPGGTWVQLVDHLKRPYRLPGHNPAAFVFDHIEVTAIRVRVFRLPYIEVGYALAFSEIQVLRDGENIAAAASIQDNSFHTDPDRWTREALVDGNTSVGRLIGWQQWLNELSDRKTLEERLEVLLQSKEVLAQQAHRRLRLLTLVVLGLFLAVGAGFAAYGVFQRRQRQREIEWVRERIAGDLHDEVGSNLGGIQLHADLLKLKGADSQELSVVQNLAAETMVAVRDIVWLLRPRASERIVLADHLKETGAILMDGLDWTFEADEACQALELPEMLVHNLMLFYREVLHNLRHAHAETANIGIRRSGQRLQLVIRDDGCGIPPEKLERPATLRALRARAKRMGGTMDLQTEVGSGTTITLTVTLG